LNFVAMLLKPDGRFNRESDQAPVRTVIQTRKAAKPDKNPKKPVETSRIGEPLRFSPDRPVQVNAFFQFF